MTPEQILLHLPKARTVLHGLNSIVFRDSILWDAISDEVKSSQSRKLISNHGKEIIVIVISSIS